MEGDPPTTLGMTDVVVAGRGARPSGDWGPLRPGPGDARLGILKVMAKIVFDGKKEAERMATFLEESERVLGKSLVILQCDGRSEESTYVRLKREMGERLGAMVSVDFRSQISDLREGIKLANEDETVDGILVQLPIIGADREEVEQILSSIKPSKDVDGLNPKGRFIPAAIRAVERLVDIFKITEDDQVAGNG